MREIAPGITAGLPSVITAIDVDGYDVAFTLDLTPEGVRPNTIAVTAREGSPPVSGNVLRRMRIADLTAGAIEWSITGASTDAGFPLLPGRPSHELMVEAKQKGPTDAVLTAVALSYRVAQMAGYPTSKYIQSVWAGAPKSTVGNWVRLARERGFLTDDPAHPDGPTERVNMSLDTGMSL